LDRAGDPKENDRALKGEISAGPMECAKNLSPSLPLREDFTFSDATLDEKRKELPKVGLKGLKS
jgi:hypothetical protein